MLGTKRPRESSGRSTAGVSAAKRAKATEEDTKVKEDLSRMKGAYGERMIKKLKGMKIAVFGLRGVGIEAAKNLLLAGPHTVVVHDDETVQIEDLGANFYLGESDVGKSRAEACRAELADINPNTYFRVHSGPVDTALLRGFSVVVFTDLQKQWPPRKLLELDAFCGQNDIKFIWAGVQGMHMSLFSNFGRNHEIFDPDGTPGGSLVIEDIQRVPAPYGSLGDFLDAYNAREKGVSDKEAAVRLLESKLGVSFDAKRRKRVSYNELLDIAEGDPRTANPNAFAGKVTCAGARHVLNTGDWVKFEEVEMAQSKGSADMVIDEVAAEKYPRGTPVKNINSVVQITDHRTNPRVFFIGDPAPSGSYVKGGIGNQQKMAVTKQYQSLKEQLYKPSIELGVQNFMKFGVAPKLHLGLLAIMEFFDENGRYPTANDAKAVLGMASQIRSTRSVDAELDEELITKMASFSRAETNALAAISGGFVAQEAMKQTGKFTPVNQWIHFDAFEIVTKQGGDQVKSDRYKHYRSLFGDEFVTKAHESNFFLVGCGALGCEFLKNIAMLGLGCKGAIHITDDDVIELSNLSRQFLFRRKHVSKLKSESAAGVACAMNPEIKSGINVHNIRVEPKTENVFNTPFWNKLDFVINALDNVHARNYMDGKCVVFAKPLFESGTLGTQANASVHIPHKTPSYKEGSPPGEGGGIAMCTLTNFPYEPLHCIEWSRTMFGQMFEDGPAAYEDLRSAGVETFLEKVASNESEGLDKLRNALRWAKLARGASAQTCVRLAFDMFVAEFRDRVKDLIHAFPADKKDKNGLSFWRGRKRFPFAQEWDVADPRNIDFIWHTAFVFADVLGVPKSDVTRETCAKIAAGLVAPAWRPKKIDVDEDEEGAQEKKKTAPSMGADEYKELESLTSELKSIDVSSLPALSPADFEKDDDANHHVDWITSAANLRADTRKIKRSDRHHCRMVAGRIIAAIATATASITGFVFLEVYKLLLGFDDVNKFNWTTVNLATNQIISEMPADPVRNVRQTVVDRVEEQDQIVEKKTVKIAVPDGFTCYDFFDLKGDVTFSQLFDALAAAREGALRGLRATSVFARDKVLYNEINLDYQRTRLANAQKRLAAARSAGHKRMFQKMVDSAKKMLAMSEQSRLRRVSDAYFEICGSPPDEKQQFLVLEVTFEPDPAQTPQWISSFAPKQDDLNSVEIVTPKVRLFWRA